MDINELRKQVITGHDEIGMRGQAVVGALLVAALICSLATLFFDQPVLLPAAAIVFLALGLLGARSLERRSLRS
jgi:ABC-type uncharacterized transport system permease subunit